LNNSIKISKNGITIPSSTKYLRDIRDFIAEFGDENRLPSKLISQISLAVDEACTNVIKHAYKNSSDNEINLEIKKSNNKIKISIKDNGIHFDPASIHDPDIEESQKKKKGGGLGIFLMKKLMDKVEYKIRDNMNELVLIKNL